MHDMVEVFYECHMRACLVVGLVGCILLSSVCLIHGFLVAGISRDSVMSLQGMYLKFCIVSFGVFSHRVSISSITLVVVTVEALSAQQYCQQSLGRRAGHSNSGSIVFTRSYQNHRRLLIIFCIHHEKNHDPRYVTVLQSPKRGIS